MLKKVIPIITVVSLCLLIILLSTTAPSSVGPFGILIVFILGYMSSLGVVTYFLYSMSFALSRLSSVMGVSRPIIRLGFQRAYYYSTVIAAGPIMLIGFQSVGSIAIYEIVLVGLFIGIGCVYIAKRIR